MKAGEKFSTALTAAKAGVSVHQLRIYIQLGLVAPCMKTRGGHGQFDSVCVERLRLIHAAVQSGLLLNELRGFFQALDKDNIPALKQEQAILVARLATRRQMLQTCKTHLTHMVNRMTTRHAVP